MKKQVAFADSRTVQGLHRDEALPRCTGTNESKMALKDASVNVRGGLKINGPPAATCEPQLQHTTSTQIPKTMTAAPFLKHTALTPAQKEYLYAIAASYSTALVRDLLTQHYMNVLRRCIRAVSTPCVSGHSPERDDLAVTSVALPGTGETDKRRAEVPSRAKHKETINSSARNPGKFFLPKNPKQTSQAFQRVSAEAKKHEEKYNITHSEKKKSQQSRDQAVGGGRTGRLPE